MEVPWPGSGMVGGRLTISLRDAGDQGPSGHRGRDIQEVAARERGQPLPVLCPSQTHSLRVIQCRASGTVQVWEGYWTPAPGDAPGQESSLSIRAEAPVPVPREEQAAWVGAQEADGVLADWPVTLGVTVADCLPVALVSGSWRGLLHSGWQGTGILAVALQALALGLGATAEAPHSLAVGFGPSIAPRDYPVPPTRADLFARRFGLVCTPVLDDGQPALDIPRANQGLLAAVRGFTPWLEIWEGSTATDPALQSYRRDGSRFGRMLVLLG